MKFNLGYDLYEACRKNDLTRAREVLAASAHECLAWNAPRSGWTPLHAAADAGSVELVDCLLAAGADANAKSSAAADPPLQVAIHSMFLDRRLPSARYDTGKLIVLRLLASGADAALSGSQGCSADGLARLYGDEDLAEHLKHALPPRST